MSTIKDTTPWINSELFVKDIGKQLNEAMTRAAEPIIQKALKEAEISMRKQLAACLISLIDESYVLDRQGLDIRIVIHRPEPQKP